MKTENVLWTVAVIVAILLIVFHKTKVCVSTTGDARQVPWLFPCKSDEQAVTA